MKTRPKLRPEGVWRLLHLIGIHKWWSVYTKYDHISPGYKIDWEQYCPYCDRTRSNPLHLR